MRRTSLLLTGLVMAASLPALAQSPTKPAPSKPALATKPAPAAPAKPGAAPAAAAPTPPAGAVLLSVKDVMRHIVNPAAEAFWARSGEVDDEKGANDRIPKAEDDANWKVTMDSSAQLVEAGNRLLLDARANDASGAWKKYALALTNAGLAGMSASQAKNHDKTNDAGNAMYDACFQCHGRYIVRPKDSLYKHDIDQDFKDAGRSPK
jgi:hypothetical protein